MTFAACRLSLAPMRREPDVVSEMVNEVRAGEGVAILETRGNFHRARLLVDGYLGWIDARQFTRPADAPPPVASWLTDDLCGAATCGECAVAFPMGTPLPEFDPADGSFALDGTRWQWQGRVREVPAVPSPDVDAVLAYARRFLRTPYRWGGRSVFGIDCSGFASSVLRAFGIPIARDCVQQIDGGTPVPDLAEAVPGDLVYFGATGEAAHHVGILLPDGEILHASAMVRIDDLTKDGIVNRESGTLTHELKAIRRYLPARA